MKSGIAPLLQLVNHSVVLVRVVDARKTHKGMLNILVLKTVLFKRFVIPSWMMSAAWRMSPQIFVVAAACENA